MVRGGMRDREKQEKERKERRKKRKNIAEKIHIDLVPHIFECVRAC